MLRALRLPVTGFSLIELMLTLAIMGSLAMLVAPVAQTAIQRQKERALQRALTDVRQAIDAYKRAADDGRVAKPAGASGYPASLEVLVDGVVDQRDPRHGKLYFLRQLPTDPMNPGRPWGLRSYESDPDQPREGADVFDLHTQAEGLGLNGVPYGRW